MSPVWGIEAGRKLTAMDALKELATSRLASRAFDLRQAGVEVRAGIREGKVPDWDSPTDWINSFKEIAPQTFLLTTLMAGAGTGVVATSKAIKDIKKSLRKEIGTGHG